MSLAQCTEDVANSCWAWNCNARHCCAKRRAPRRGIGCANATAPCAPRRRTRFAVMAPTLVHFCTKFAEKKEGLARQKRLERHYRWVVRGCRWVPRDLRTLPTWLPLHAPRRRALLPPPTSPAIRSGDSLSLSLSFAEQSQCDGTAVRLRRRRAQQQQRRLHLRICKMH